MSSTPPPPPYSSWPASHLPPSPPHTALSSQNPPSPSPPHTKLKQPFISAHPSSHPPHPSQHMAASSGSLFQHPGDNPSYHQPRNRFNDASFRGPSSTQQFTRSDDYSYQPNPPPPITYPNNDPRPTSSHSDAISASSSSSAWSPVASVLSLPGKGLSWYDQYISKHSGQVSQIESALRSLTYIIPGRFRDAEVASESIHSAIQLLSVYHDSLLSRASDPAETAKTPRGPSQDGSGGDGSKKTFRPPVPTGNGILPTPHTRYTRHWVHRSPLYRRVATFLHMLTYVQLLCEMVAKRRGGEQTRWRIVVVLESMKTVCKFVLFRCTNWRPLLSPALPERPPLSEADTTEEAKDGEPSLELRELMGEFDGDDKHAPGGGNSDSDDALLASFDYPNRFYNQKPAHEREWKMPRTGMRLPGLPNSRDISSYLMDRVLTADDIQPAPKLVNQTRHAAFVAEVLHILAPLVYAGLMAQYVHQKKNRSTSRSSPSSSSSPLTKALSSIWTPWLAGVTMEYAARQLRNHSAGTTALEREEWKTRTWDLGRWTMKGAFYEQVVKGVMRGVRSRVPNLVGGILEDYEYLWENYHFST